MKSFQKTRIFVEKLSMTLVSHNDRKHLQPASSAREFAMSIRKSGQPKPRLETSGSVTNMAKEEDVAGTHKTITKFLLSKNMVLLIVSHFSTVCYDCVLLYLLVCYYL